MEVLGVLVPGGRVTVEVVAGLSSLVLLRILDLLLVVILIRQETGRTGHRVQIPLLVGIH